MKVLIVMIFASLMLYGCKKVVLDSFAFPSEKVDAYQFEEFEGGEIVIPDSLKIEASNRTEVSMISKDAASGEEYTIYGVYIGDMATISTDTVILYLHGQSKHMDYYWTRATLLANVGGKHNYGVLMIDYRGYGKSEGSSSEQGLFEDADAAILWLKNHGANASRTFYYGYSLGAIPAIDRAAYKSDFVSTKIMLESPLASIEYLVHGSTVITVNPGYVTDLEFENAEKIKDFGGSLLWMHGKDDDYIAIENGELIYSNHSGFSKTAYRIDGSGHSEVPNTMGVELYMQRVLNFIRE
ncbi:MAG: alpha/beta hydrolase [Crocinitomicaceae bacterium]|nr:alpha/beta hydrolase [Crocinitomicaceae bacterium]